MEYNIKRELHTGAEVLVAGNTISFEYIKAIAPIKPAEDVQLMRSDWFNFYFEKTIEEGDLVGVVEGLRVALKYVKKNDVSALKNIVKRMCTDNGIRE